MTTLREYLRLFLFRWFGYDPKPKGTEFPKYINGYSTTTSDGQWIGNPDGPDGTQDIINAIKEASARYRP